MAIPEFEEEIETERLMIRPPRPKYAEQLLAAVDASRERIAHWLPWAVQHDKTESHESQLLQQRQLLRERYGDFVSRKDLMYLLFLKEGDTLIGGSGLHRIDWSVPRFEIGYWIATGHEGKGYISESTDALTTFAFDSLGARRVEIKMDASNHRSRAVPERLGFLHEGTIINDSRHHATGELRDTLIFAKTRAD